MSRFRCLAVSVRLLLGSLSSSGDPILLKHTGRCIPLMMSLQDLTIRYSTAALLSSTGLLVAAVVVFVQCLFSPLRRIPGPRIATLTDIWRLRNALSGREEIINLELHEKYGEKSLASNINLPGET